MIKIFNTLTREKEPFKPIHENEVKMYVCGPTVYNYIHIGNARSAVSFDTIRRYLEYRGYNVTYVSNFTDVDDKMIKQAKKEDITVDELANRFIDAFMADTKALNIKPATDNPRATHMIGDIIEFIEALVKKGYAYEVSGNVYFRARHFQHYGELSKQNIEQLENGASQHLTQEEVATKEDPLDFVLWKPQKEDSEIAWDSPFGKGRPGWHIECSVMSTKLLGETFDIHGGGQDLQFPHHENEIAQSEAKTGQKFVNYWMHNGFVTVGNQNEKMSKSAGNFVTVHDLLKQEDATVLRFFMASTQYRRPIHYNDDNMQEARERVQYFKNLSQNIDYRLNDQTESKTNTELKELVETKISDFQTAMDDDFNVQNGLTVLYELMRAINQHLQESTVDKTVLADFKAEFVKIMTVFGVQFEDQSADLSKEVEALIQKRDEARSQKDFQTSDQIRDQLKDMGIVIEDTPQGTRWKRNED
ncbi:cysteine--tRNA ligase [Holzapfeliella sp. He02]|uniref:Cysteine--tRNA ligase n=1 Tax=Holzapfeliella saturejae TaxID=3082953 RepID=A0ABU8SFU9_9LACO